MPKGHGHNHNPGGQDVEQKLDRILSVLTQIQTSQNTAESGTTALLNRLELIKGQLTNVLSNQEVIIMAGKTVAQAIADFSAAQTAFNQQLSDKTDEISTDVDNVTADVGKLNDLITQLQNNAPSDMPADAQAALDSLVTAGQALVDKMAGVKVKADALDALTPPAVPPVSGGAQP